MQDNVAFIILNYKNSVDTIICVKSIFEYSPNSKVVVVDNGSKNNSLEKIIKEFSEDDRLHFVALENNLGFSAGNNVGCQYAREKLNPDFYCVFNNDTYIDDYDFSRKLYNKYEETNFDVLGPKIWNIVREFNQNPSIVLNSLEDVKAALKRHKMLNKYLYSFFPISYWLRNKMIKSRIGVEGLNGAALIFSKKYSDKFEELFYPGVFLYCEEDLLQFRRTKYDLIFAFDFDICVFHNHSATTRKMTKSTVKKWKFQHQEIGKSLKFVESVYNKDL
ncbi:MAG: glycosyltransferase [Erysipelotrichales bacterium]|nr:glycosyltransferase [Erysipelotrichales bacterium]